MSGQFKRDYVIVYPFRQAVSQLRCNALIPEFLADEPSTSRSEGLAAFTPRPGKRVIVKKALLQKSADGFFDYPRRESCCL